jgi:hypothetical protein
MCRPRTVGALPPAAVRFAELLPRVRTDFRAVRVVQIAKEAVPRTEAQIHDDDDRCSLRSRHSVGESRLCPKFPVLHHAQPFSGMRSGMAAADTASTVSSTIRVVDDSPEGSPNVTPPSTSRCRAL